MSAKLEKLVKDINSRVGLYCGRRERNHHDEVAIQGAALINGRLVFTYRNHGKVKTINMNMKSLRIGTDRFKHRNAFGAVVEYDFNNVPVNYH